MVGSEDGLSSDARFFNPVGVVVAGDGTLYVADSSNNSIRKGVSAGPPVISNQPVNQTVAPGGNVQFTVVASGVPTPTYQWYLNGSPFAGATSSSLSFTNARSSDAGTYSVVVTNAMGSVVSNSVTLVVSNGTGSPGSSPGGGGSVQNWFVLGVMVAGVGRLICTGHKKAR